MLNLPIDPLRAKPAPSGSGTFLLRLGATEFIPLPGRCLWNPQSATVFVADAHFGKSALLRREVPGVPVGTTATDLARLGAVLRSTNAATIVFLGDTLHATAVRNTGIVQELANWVQSVGCTCIAIPGNHDKKALHVLQQAGMEVWESGADWQGVKLFHEPPQDCSIAALCGHLHPGIICKGLGRQRVRLPCFWLHKNVCCLPAFGSFTGLHTVAPVASDRIIAIAEETLLEIPR